jgi:hypothetical protein
MRELQSQAFVRFPWHRSVEERFMKDVYSRMAGGMAIGVGLGAVVGVATDNIPLGISIGIAIGAGAGAALPK